MSGTCAGEPFAGVKRTKHETKVSAALNSDGGSKIVDNVSLIAFILFLVRWTEDLDWNAGLISYILKGDAEPGLLLF